MKNDQAAELEFSPLDNRRLKKLWPKVVLIGVLLGALPPVQAEYYDAFQAWSATSAASWQTKSLAGAPFNIPPGAVVEIALRNGNTSSARDGGVRAVGSSLERRLTLRPATGGGVDTYIIHVQTDSNSQIQHYAQNTTDVDFVLLGYWDCGAYVERFDSFNGSTAWSDQSLSTYGVKARNVVEFVMANDAPSTQYFAGVRENGSAVDRRVELSSPGSGVAMTSMMVKADNTASATIETYAGHVNKVTFYLVGYWSAPPGDYHEAFSDIGSPSTSATWEDKDLTAYGVVDNGVAEFILANSFATDEDNMGVRTNGSSLSRYLNLRQNGNGGGTFGRMHVPSDATATIEFYHQDVSDTHHFYLTGYWDVGASTGAILSDHPAGQETDAFHENGDETNAELFAFRLNPCGGSFTVTQLVFRLTGIVGLVNGDWAGIELLVDTNGDGNISGGASTPVGGTGVVNQAAGTITFSTSFNVTAETMYIFRADFASLSWGDQVTIGLAAADITTSGGTSGATTSVTHKEKIDCYVENFQSWTATSANTWETKSLAASPFSVPADSVVEIAVRNASGSNERYGGVRAVGSSLERRLQINQATGGGVDVLVMHVQTDSSSQIQHYAENTTDVDFVLLGYWKCGTYVEGFDSFTIANNTTWTDTPLCSYGVGPGHIAEIVLTNSDTGNENEAGVRTNGSSLARKFNIHQASGGGVDTVTLFVEADTSTTSIIEAYAQDKTKVTFYHVGYWSEAPLAYTEQFSDVGSPSSSATWQDKDLTANGIGDTEHAEFVLSNEDAGNERSLGVRENGSSLSRSLNNQEAQGGGADFSRMEVASDLTATIEWYHSNIASTNSYFLVGEWGSCGSSNYYVITDLGAINSAKSSLGYHVNGSGKVAGFEEDSSGNPTAWLLDCGSFTALGTLGGSYAEAHGINTAGRVVGWAHNASGKRRAFTYSGSMVDLGVILSRHDSEAQAVNATSEVVGTVFDFANPAHNKLAFLYLPADAHTLTAGMNSLGTLGGTESEGFGINDSGQVVGGAQNVSSYYRPFRWANGVMTDLGTLGGDSIKADHRAEAINATGQVAGRSYTAGGAAHAFYWDGSMTDLSVLTGGTESWAFGINDSNVVVGTSNVTGGAYHAFVWDIVNGLRDLNSLIAGGSGWTLTRATDIANDGTIVGWGTNGSGKVRAFKLTPTCKQGGGAATVDMVIASGSGTTDVSGVFDQVVRDAEGEPLAAIELLAPQEGASIHFEVAQPVLESDHPGPGTFTLEGFADGKGFARLVKVEASDSDQSVLTVSLHLSFEDISQLAESAPDLALHVFDDVAGKWVPAGNDIGASAPTGVVGESGYTVSADSSVDYWCVRHGGGQFAVGKPLTEQVTPPRPTPRGCGPAMLPCLLCGAVTLSLLRGLRSTCRR